MSLTAEIVFPLPLPRSFRYSVPAEMAATVRPGVRVAAPLGTKTHTGFIIRLEEGGPADGLVLKEILDVLDADPVVTAGDIAFAQALAAHFRSSTGEFLQAMLPPSLEFRGTAKTRLTEAGLVALRDGSLRGEERSVAVALGDRAYTIFHWAPRRS